MFIGIDLGTTEIKVVLVSDDHELVASQRVALSTSRPHPLWSEQDPEHWWTALDGAMTALAASTSRHLRAVRGIGLAGQMHGAVLLDEHDAILRPAILWNDGRSSAQCQALERSVPELSTLTGNRAMPGFTAPKLLWVREHEPELFARVTRVLLPKDFLRLRLAGVAMTDCSDASGTLWLDVGRRMWSPRMLAASGMTAEQMPKVVEGSAVAGTLLPALAARWGLSADTVIAGGGGDNAASAVGCGAIDPGEGFVSLGTSGVIFLVSDGFRPDPASGMHAFCHALPGRWHQMSVMLSAASCLQWAARLLGVADEGTLITLAHSTSTETRSRAPLFLPYLSGERTPHNNAHAQGVLFGLTHEHDSAAIAWSVLEGVSFGLADGYATLGRSASARSQALALVGGGSRSAIWAQLLASALGTSLRVSAGNESIGAVGAARLGYLASGGQLGALGTRDDPATRVFEPDAGVEQMLAPRLYRFRELYRRLEPGFFETS